MIASVYPLLDFVITDPMAASNNLGLDEQMKTLNAAGSVIFGQGQKPNQV